LEPRIVLEQMLQKLREIQVGSEFDSELSRIKSQSHVEMTDVEYFREIVKLVYDAGFRGSVVEKHNAELTEAFANYDFRKVARQDFRSLFAASPIKNRKKVKGCLKNAKQLIELVAEYGSFEAYLRSFGDVAHDVKSFLKMQRDMRSRFAYLGPTNFYAFMKYIGFDFLKPDVHLRVIMSRLGLTSSPKCSEEEVLVAANGIRDATGEQLRIIDQIFYTYGSSDHGRVKKAICGDKPLCEECYLPKYCDYYKKRHTEAAN
jgi:DNA-3-methyladenine glycosylase I